MARSTHFPGVGRVCFISVNPHKWCLCEECFHWNTAQAQLHRWRSQPCQKLTRTRTFLEEPFAQTWQCLQPPVGAGVKTFTGFLCLNQALFKISLTFSSVFLWDLIIIPQRLIQQGLFSSPSFRQFLGNHVESSDAQMTFKGVFRAVWNPTSCYLIIIEDLQWCSCKIIQEIKRANMSFFFWVGQKQFLESSVAQHNRAAKVYRKCLLSLLCLRN